MDAVYVPGGPPFVEQLRAGLVGDHIGSAAPFNHANVEGAGSDAFLHR